MPSGVRPLAGLSLLLAVAIAHAGDSVQWTARFDDYYNRFVTEYSTDTYFANSDNLAWAESYVQRGLLDMWALTGEAAYIHRFARRADRMFSVVSDLDRDGRPGWGTFDLSVPLARNRQFEEADPNDASMPRYWRRTVPAPGSAFRDANAGFPVGSGFGVTLKASSQYLSPGIEANLSNDTIGYRGQGAYTPGALYQIWWHGRAPLGQAAGQVVVLDASTNTVLGSSRFQDRDWRYRALQFRAPQEPGRTIVVRLLAVANSFAGGTVQIDNVHVQQYAEYLAHDAQIAIPLMKAVRIIESNQALSLHVVDGLTMGERALQWRRCVENWMVDKWRSSLAIQPNGDTSYTAPNDGSTVYPNQSHPTNINLLAASMLVGLGRPEDRDIALAIARTYESRFQREGDRYFWNYHYQIGSNDRPTNTWDDVSHANAAVEFAIDADVDNLGLDSGSEVFDPWIVQRFSSTFIEALWNRSTTNPLLSWAIIGDHETDEPRSQVGGWAALSPYSMDVWRVIDALYEAQRYWSYDLAAPNRHRASVLLSMARLARWADLRNGGMEAPEPTDPTLPMGWRRFQATTRTAYLTNDAAFGSSAARIETSPRMGRQILEQRFTSYPLGQTMRVRFVAKTDRPYPGGVVEVVNCSTGEVLGRTQVTSSFFASHTLQFKTPRRSNQDVRLRVGYFDWTVRAAITIDGVRLER